MSLSELDPIGVLVALTAVLTYRRLRRG